MAKTLVGLYDAFTDAQQVVEDLAKAGFSRSDISLATHSTGGVKNQHTDYSYAEQRASAGSRGGELINLLTNNGVPRDEADSYAEGVRRGGTLVLVKASEGETDRGLEIMKRLQPVDIDHRLGEWRREGWSRFDPDAEPYATNDVTRERERYGKRMTDEGEVTIPVVEEELTVGKREVAHDRIRIHTYIEEQPVTEEVRLREERVHVERHPVDRPATEADLENFTEETMEFTETAEEAVVSRRARVVEEVTVQTDVEEHTETVHDTVRRTHVDVDQEGTQSATRVTGIETYDADFRQHHTSTFASSGGAYADYEPAYRYGYTLGTEERYHGRDWSALESDARRDWEARHTGTWDRYKDAIRYGWEKVRTRS
jgi:stress response protein YsnF